MTRWLALDTSTWWGGMALLEDGGEGAREVASIRVRVRDSHAARVLAAVDHLLGAAGWSRKDPDAFAAVRGPGSFTGIRVGLGILRGLAVASGKPCYGVDALESLAEALGPTSWDRVPLLDASRGEVYGARYDGASSPPATRIGPWLGPAERAVEGGTGDALAFGTGALRYRSQLEAAGLRLADGPPPEGIAAAAGRIASLRAAQGAAPGTGLDPLYIRPSDAELGRH